jgi:membrane-bound lytic murein transglycosylase D
MGCHALSMVHRRRLLPLALSMNHINHSDIPVLKVSVETNPGAWHTYRFNKQFTIGRLEECDVILHNTFVSRVHIEGVYQDGCWRIRDHDSVNGLVHNGQRVQSVVVEELTILRLGPEGPEVRFEVETIPSAHPAGRKDRGSDPALEPIIDRYVIGLDGDEPAGPRTVQIRRAIAKVEKKRRNQFRLILAGMLTPMLVAGLIAFHEHSQLAQQRKTAEELFYEIKAQDVELASLDRALASTNNPAGEQQVAKFRATRQQLEKSYDEYLATLQIYNPKLSEKQRALLRIARIFGECELEMPAGFEAEVDRYIEKWRSSGRLKAAVQTAQENGYTDTITRELMARGLPPQFFYLALQESNFNVYAVGPKTRKGFAKGMWQFIPETAVKYNLHLGPLVDQARPDPRDDRHNYVKATKAAALYLQDLTATDAQASGFLVMACYNWGENQILPLIDSMPANPKERNFWKLLKKHRNQIPQETYDYVFYIVSAAVIGENPRMFGFDFDSPLARLGVSEDISPDQSRPLS